MFNMILVDKNDEIYLVYVVIRVMIRRWEMEVDYFICVVMKDFLIDINLNDNFFLINDDYKISIIL